MGKLCAVLVDNAIPTLMGEEWLPVLLLLSLCRAINCRGTRQRTGTNGLIDRRRDQGGQGTWQEQENDKRIFNVVTLVCVWVSGCESFWTDSGSE